MNTSKRLHKTVIEKKLQNVIGNYNNSNYKLYYEITTKKPKNCSRKV